jgi:chromatin structure-remodeling complex subunit RSC1/2
VCPHDVVVSAKFFDRDAQTNEVLWFAAPPMNVVRTPAPQYSLAYLHFLAAKRKRAGDAVGEAGEEASKRTRVETTAEVTGRALEELLT